MKQNVLPCKLLRVQENVAQSQNLDCVYHAMHRIFMCVHRRILLQLRQQYLLRRSRVLSS